MLEDYINGNKFDEFANSISNSTELYKGQNWSNDILEKNAIIMCKTDYLEQLFNKLQFSSKKYILITGYSDYLIDYNKFCRKLNCIKKWFGTNIAYKHDDLITIPIGIANYTDGTAYYDLYIRYLVNNIEELRNINKDYETVYCNWRCDEYRPVSRKFIIPKLIENNFKIVVEENLDWDEYFKRMPNYKFVISPPGNGPDCHRTWEILYANSIPIVIKNYIYEKYNLPILQVNDYSELTDKLLKTYLQYYENHKFSYEQLTMNYWRNLISQEFLKIK